MVKKQKLTLKKYLTSIGRVGMTSFRLSPIAGIVQLIDSVVRALLPIATTYFAALTTSALAAAYAGDPDAAQNVFVYVLITSGISVVMLLWNSISNYISQKTRYVIDAAVEDKMRQHFGSLPFELYDDKDVIDLQEKARRFSYVFSTVFNTIGSMIVSIVGSIGALVALTFVNAWLALAVTIAIIPGIVIQLRLARQQARHWEGNITNRRRMGNMGWMLADSRNMAELRMYGVLKHIMKNYAKLREKDEKQRLDFELRSIWKQTLADVGEALVELGALIWIVLEIIARAQPVGQFLFVQQMVSRAMGQASSLAVQLGSIDEDLANLVDYQRFMDIAVEKEKTQAIQHVPQRIEIDKVTFRYPKTNAAVLDEVSMVITAGQHVAIVGENGAGKSTLIKLIMGLYSPNHGEIRVDGLSLADVTPESWHRHIAMLGQEFISYYFATIDENITLGDVSRVASSARVKAAMDKAEFADVVKKLEHGGNTYIERWMAENNDEATATELSGGQYQRLALARNFYRDSPIIILDEPTSAIDALAESRIFKRLFADTDKTIITISHRLSTVEKADVIYMLEQGKIVEQGTHKELVSQRGAYFRMFESQISGS
ncbi:MAG: Lipid A export ATP-binding/permease protein MsbA [Candidatus Saccharibacteria bacterium GW2011_GWC2_48_9]|nr:MAG: Lipid A export ATP-binding/permease protein MsbA [Candidatus Saccharibacteria bacterium GW2011_GWC2_48_9]HCH34188.1 ABC transporter [Candidatus Saccharibacteria bacterium]